MRHAHCRRSRRWALWLAATAGSFAALETAGWDANETLTHFLQDVLRTDTRPGRVLVVVVAAGTFTWLVLHLLDPKDNFAVEDSVNGRFNLEGCPR